MVTSLTASWNIVRPSTVPPRMKWIRSSESEWICMRRFLTQCRFNVSSAGPRVLHCGDLQFAREVFAARYLSGDFTTFSQDGSRVSPYWETSPVRVCGGDVVHALGRPFAKLRPPRFQPVDDRLGNQSPSVLFTARGAVRDSIDCADRLRSGVLSPTAMRATFSHFSFAQDGDVLPTRKRAAHCWVPSKVQSFNQAS